MKILYLKEHNLIDKQILQGYLRRDGEIIMIEEEVLVIPSVINITGKRYPTLNRVLGNHCKELFELNVSTKPSPGALDRFQFRLTRAFQKCLELKVDAIVIYSPGQDLQLVKDAFDRVNGQAV